MTSKKLFLGSFSEKRLQEKILSIIKELPNPYPPDLFRWDNNEQITDTRGKYNKMFYTIVENTKDDIVKALVDEELENHTKEVELTPSDLELLKQNLAYDIEDCENEGITKGHKERAEQGKALLKKLEAVK